MIVVADYGRGNLYSIAQALRKLDVDPVISSDPVVMRQASRIVFPGVGSFADAMDGLRSRNLVTAIREAISTNTPLLGICVGCQLLLAAGEEFGEHEGLGIIPGRVRRLLDGNGLDADVRIPNVGWRSVVGRSDAPVVGELSESSPVYFVHSFAPFPDDAGHIGATCRLNGEDVPVAVHSGSAIGVQFHPEKSGPVGLDLLRRFLEWHPKPGEHQE